jgi:hypothetical protein
MAGIVGIAVVVLTGTLLGKRKSVAAESATQHTET